MTWVVYGQDADISTQTLMGTVPAAKESLCCIEFCNRGTTPATISFWAGGTTDQYLKESVLQLGAAGLSNAVLSRQFIATSLMPIYAQASNANVTCHLSADETAIT